MGNMGLTQVPAPSPLLASLLELFWSKSLGNAVHTMQRVQCPSLRPISSSSWGFWDSAPASWLMVQLKLMSPGSGCFFLISQRV